MPLGIGNNLIRNGGGLNPDKLALDLQFAADKTLTARKGPTPTFTRASSGTFVGSNGLIQSAGNNVARFDHNPVTLASSGLLIEESRTNLFVRSDNFTSTSWLISNATVSSDVTTSPDGLTTADKLITDSGSNLGRVAQTFTLTGSHSMSVFAKASEWNWVFIAPLGATGGVWFDLLNGSVGTQNSGFVGSISSFGNGWYRCIVSFTGTSTSLTARIVSTNANGVQSTGDGTSGIFIWGAQLEAGSFPTSYIPTTTSSVVRSADVCSITGANFTNLWNTSGGTFLFDGVLPSAPTLTNRLLLSSGGSRRWLYGNLAGQGGMSETLSAFDGTTTPSYFTNVRLTTRFKIAISVEALACRASFNGSSVNSISHNGNLLNSVTLLALCEGGAGTITGVRYYRKNLANAKLQALTV